MKIVIKNIAIVNMIEITIQKAFGESIRGIPSVRIANIQLMSPSGRKMKLTTVKVFIISF